MFGWTCHHSYHLLFFCTFGSIYVEHITKWHERSIVNNKTNLLICDWYTGNVVYLPVEVPDYTSIRTYYYYTGTTGVTTLYGYINDC